MTEPPDMPPDRPELPKVMLGTAALKRLYWMVQVQEYPQVLLTLF
jgi:hypothetical protein